jgi:hypothetical protein
MGAGQLREPGDLQLVTITEEKLAELEALAAAATPGPWRVSMSGYSVKSYDADVPIVATPRGGAQATGKQLEHWHANSDLIAAARDAVPALVAEVRRLREVAADNSQAYVDLETERDQAAALAHELVAERDMHRRGCADALSQVDGLVAEREALRAEVERLRAALSREEAEAELHADGLRALLKSALPHVDSDAIDLDDWDNHEEAAAARAVASAIRARLGLAADGSSSGGKTGCGP